MITFEFFKFTKKHGFKQVIKIMNPSSLPVMNQPVKIKASNGKVYKGLVESIVGNLVIVFM